MTQTAFVVTAENSTIVPEHRLVLKLLRHGLAVTSRLAPGLARRWATHLFCKPPRHPRPEVEQNWLSRGEACALMVRGRSVAAWRWGQGGPKVALVHGWGGRGSQLWAFIAPLLDAGCEVWAFDAPGHGENRSRYASLVHFAQTLQALDARCGGLQAVVAHSLGGAATSFALARGWLAAERVVLIGTPNDFEGYSRLFAQVTGLTESVRQAMLRHLEHRLGIRWEEVQGSHHARLNRVPALIIHDREDREVPLSSGELIASHWQGAQLMVTEGLGHRRILRDEAVVRRAASFALAGPKVG